MKIFLNKSKNKYNISFDELSLEELTDIRNSLINVKDIGILLQNTISKNKIHVKPIGEYCTNTKNIEED